MADYFTDDELRAAHPELANATRYTTAALGAARAFAEQWWETAAKVAYVPRLITDVLDGNGRRVLFLSRWIEVGAVSSITIDDVALTAGELADVTVRRYGAIERALGWPDGSRIVVTYTHGYTSPATAPNGALVKEAVMMLCAEHLLPSTIPMRATSISTDLGNYRISQADKTGKTGIPKVDAIIALVGADKPVAG